MSGYLFKTVLPVSCLIREFTGVTSQSLRTVYNIHLSSALFTFSEAGFSQRERLSLQKCEDELSQKFHQQLEQERKNWQEDNLKKLENLKLDQQSEMQMKLSELDKLQKSNIESMVQKATSDLRKKV